jgi:hypothetical protein
MKREVADDNEAIATRRTGSRIPKKSTNPVGPQYYYGPKEIPTEFVTYKVTMRCKYCQNEWTKLDRIQIKLQPKEF